MTTEDSTVDTPSAQHTRFGLARLDLPGEVVAGSLGTWRVEYTAGQAGVRRNGAIAFAWAWPADWGQPQWTEPAGENFATFTASGDCRLVPRYELKLRTPIWNPQGTHALCLTVADGELRPGDTVRLTLGDRRAGSPGQRAPTFRETECTLFVAVDVQGDGRWQPLDDLPSLRVAGGPAAAAHVPADRAAPRHSCSRDDRGAHSARRPRKRARRARERPLARAMRPADDETGPACRRRRGPQ